MESELRKLFEAKEKECAIMKQWFLDVCEGVVELHDLQEKGEVDGHPAFFYRLDRLYRIVKDYYASDLSDDTYIFRGVVEVDDGKE
jgi:hypothetical protein